MSGASFITVNHKILLSKLSNYGIHDSAYYWFESYLEHSTQTDKGCLLRPQVRKNVISIHLFKAYARSATNGSDIVAK